MFPKDWQNRDADKFAESDRLLFRQNLKVLYVTGTQLDQVMTSLEKDGVLSARKLAASYVGLPFIEELKRAGLSQGEREIVMRIFKGDGIVLARQEMLKYVPPAHVNQSERVARAIFIALSENANRVGNAPGNACQWQDYLSVADAAIAAYRTTPMP